MEALPCLIFPAFIAVAVVAIVLGIIKARERREAMARLAASLGFDYHPDDPWGLPARYDRFDLFERGHSKRAYNILCGAIDGRAVTAFDYKYTTGSGKNQTTHYCQAAVLALPIRAARLRLRSENLFDQVASWVGYDDIDFESDEFSRRYYVASDDRKFAYDIFHAQLIDYLLRCGRSPNIEMAGAILILYERQAGIENYRRLIQIGETIVKSIPDYVLTARAVQGHAGEAP